MNKFLLAVLLCLSTSTFAASSQRLKDPADFCHLQATFASDIITMKHQGATPTEIKQKFHSWYDNGMYGADEVKQRMIKFWVETWKMETIDNWFVLVFNEYGVNSGEAYTNEKALCQSRDNGPPK